MNIRPKEEQLIVRYLLGEATELEQNLLEARYFRDPQFYEQLLALEEELICDYVCGALSTHGQRRFEQRFLNSLRRQRKYESTKQLMACIAQRPASPCRLPVRKVTVTAARLRRAGALSVAA